MRRILFSILVLVALVGGTTTLVLTLTPQSSTAISNCGMSDTERPRHLILSCANGAVELKDLVWRQWGQERTYATGKYVWNDCNPDCATGVWHSEAITVEAYGLSNGNYRYLRGINRIIAKNGAIELHPSPQ